MASNWCEMVRISVWYESLHQWITIQQSLGNCIYTYLNVLYRLIWPNSSARVRDVIGSMVLHTWFASDKIRCRHSFAIFGAIHGLYSPSWGTFHLKWESMTSTGPWDFHSNFKSTIQLKLNVNNTPIHFNFNYWEILSVGTRVSPLFNFNAEFSIENLRKR